jgi:cell division septal protein FtsQ
MRPDHRPAGRRRLVQFAVRSVAAVLGLTIAALAGLWLARAIVDSSWLRVRHLVVTGTTRLAPADIERRLDGLRRQSLLRVDFEQYRRRVLDSPWVADVTLWRRLPSTVEVRVRERTPIALARVAEQLYLVDADGVIIAEFQPEHASLDLPIVTGLVPAARSAGRVADPDRVRLAHRFIEALAERPTLRDRLAEIDVTSPRDVAVLLGADPTLVHLGDDRFVERLTTYLDIVSSLRAELADLEYVDLRYDDRIFVKPRRRPGIAR